MTTSTYKEYVCGFMFSEPAFRIKRGAIALIEKNRPAWQKNKWNGVGGHIEEGETPLDAMRREFYEETGVRQEQWDELCRIEGEGYTCYFFRCFTDQVGDVKTKTDEHVGLHHVKDIPSNIITNLNWLIPMALYEEEGHGMPYRIREASAKPRTDQ